MFRTCCIRGSFTIVITYTIKYMVLRPRQRLSALLLISIQFFLRNSRSFLFKFIPNLPFPSLFRWRPEPFRCSNEILPWSIISIFRELRCLLKFNIFKIAIPLSDLLCSKGLDWIQVIQYEWSMLAIRVYLDNTWWIIETNI